MGIDLTEIQYLPYPSTTFLSHLSKLFSPLTDNTMCLGVKSSTEPWITVQVLHRNIKDLDLYSTGEPMKCRFSLKNLISAEKKGDVLHF